MIGLHAYLLLAALMFAIGLGGLVMRRNAVLMLLGIEIMMNAANLSLVAFWRFGALDLSGPLLALFAIIIAGAESSVGLALIIAIFRHVRSVHTEDLESLRG